MSGGKYVDDPSIYVTGKGQVLGGCNTSYYKGKALVAGEAGTAEAAREAFSSTGAQADIDKETIRSIYLETVDDLDPDTWGLIEKHDEYAQATFAENFKDSVQRYLDTGVQPAATRRTNRATDIDLLLGSKKMPNSAATALKPAWTAGRPSSNRPRAEIRRKDNQTHPPGTIDDVGVTLPFTIETVRMTGNLRALLTNAPDPTAKSKPVKLTGSRPWWEDDVVGKASVLEPSLAYELQKLGPHHDDATEAEVKKNIEDMFGAYLKRQVDFGTGVSRNLEIQKPNHPTLSATSRWRVQGVSQKPTVTLTMEPMTG